MHKFNTQRKFGEASCYIHAEIEGRDVLFTEDQVAVAVERAKRQPEDIPPRPRPLWNYWWPLAVIALVALFTASLLLHQ